MVKFQAGHARDKLSREISGEMAHSLLMEPWHGAVAAVVCVAAAGIGQTLALLRSWREIDRLRLRLDHRERQLAERAFGDRKTTAISWPFPPRLPDHEQ